MARPLRIKLVVVGASWGGIEASSQLFSALPQNFPVPVVFVQHQRMSSVGHNKLHIMVVLALHQPGDDRLHRLTLEQNRIEPGSNRHVDTAPLRFRRHQLDGIHAFGGLAKLRNRLIHGLALTQHMTNAIIA